MQGQTGAYVITSVVTPPASNNMTTPAIWGDDWNSVAAVTADPAYFARKIAEASADISAYCNRVFGIATWQNTFRPAAGIRGEGVRAANNPLKLTRWPLVNITSITEIINGVSTPLVAGTDFEIDAGSMLPGDEGPALLYRLNTAGNPRTWTATQTVVIFQAGYVMPDQNGASFPGAQALPPTLQDAAGRMVAARYFERQRDPYVMEETVFGVGTTKYFEPSPTAKEAMVTPDVADKLDKYRVPVIAAA